MLQNISAPVLGNRANGTACLNMGIDLRDVFGDDKLEIGLSVGVGGASVPQVTQR
ncbi:hypothetical protein [Thalassovita aquimarina]|uniref:hypothetical protein n=1 Tax=Thalassovita aquimarina TaxID=2785917 RepID=UPI001BAEB17C|nr:hypothetical protein [Thalassovita aquimarina]